jgi:hypothetical protein
MLKSIEPGLDYPNNTHSKAQVMRAAMGSINAPADESSMTAICVCGWRGTMTDTRRELYDSGAESWRKHAGRRGYHWNCPKCGDVVWKYYNEIN